MYHISLYENGHFCSHIGGELRTLPEALTQLKAVSVGLKSIDAETLSGIKFDREGTTCSLIITDSLGFPIKEVEPQE